MRWEEIVGQTVRRLRTARGLTQEELAHGADIDTRYVGGIERGEENPSVAILGRIAEVLDTHPAELLKEPVAGRAGR
jgi:transcriptional regulator with XRE-family HTH domain